VHSITLKIFPTTQFEYGAKNCRGAGFEVVAIIIMWYSKTPIFERILTNCATVQCFCLITTYTNYNFSLFEVPSVLICFWFNMVSIAIVVFPVCMSSIINSRWLRLIGTKLFIAFNHVCMGLCTDLRAIIPGALISTRLHSAVLKAPFPSICTPNTSTTRPSKAFLHEHSQ
jgi:hypothetical protein